MACGHCQGFVRREGSSVSLTNACVDPTRATAHTNGTGRKKCKGKSGQAC